MHNELQLYKQVKPQRKKECKQLLFLVMIKSNPPLSTPQFSLAAIFSESITNVQISFIFSDLSAEFDTRITPSSLKNFTNLLSRKPYSLVFLPPHCFLLPCLLSLFPICALISECCVSQSLVQRPLLTLLQPHSS